jgi:hypothetical protein
MIIVEGRRWWPRRGQDRRQLGGDFVIDRHQRVVLAHPERGPEDRIPVGVILKAVEAC